VCGEKLADNKNQMGSVSEDGSPPEFLKWAEAHLIRVTPGCPELWEDIGDFRDDNVPVPDDFCLELVE
jgi:hypothetical protein